MKVVKGKVVEVLKKEVVKKGKRGKMVVIESSSGEEFEVELFFKKFVVVKKLKILKVGGFCVKIII